MNISSDDADIDWMRRALALAEGVMNITTPNPRVGCVIVRDGRPIGEGATAPPGGPHAEIQALRDAAARGEAVEHSTIYVTLEPCSHHGRTPPCVDAVLEARPRRVVVAMTDPNPKVAGSGLARMREAGIDVRTGVCRDEALAQNVGFAARMIRGTPWLWLKVAGSLDGRSALHNGVSQWITGPAARAHGHWWRARACAVLTGVGTVLSDDPLLTARDVGATRMPRKIVLDTQLRTPPQARLFDGNEVWIVTASSDAARAARLEARGARILRLPDGQGSVDIAALLRWLAEEGINEVHTEAGATLNGALVRAGCVDELITYMAPVLLGDAAPMVRLPALAAMPSSREFAFTDMERVGDDILVRARSTASWEALRTRMQAFESA